MQSPCKICRPGLPTSTTEHGFRVGQHRGLHVTSIHCAPVLSANTLTLLLVVLSSPAWRTQVVEVINGCDVVCVARNDALLDGLLTVFHVERSSDELLNLQNDLPLLSDYDKECIISLAVVRAQGG